MWGLGWVRALEVGRAWEAIRRGREVLKVAIWELLACDDASLVSGVAI